MQKLLLALLALALVPVSAFGSAQTQKEPDLKTEIDRSLRWLRSVQDDATGRYGDGVESTCWALYAFAESPRKYQRRDGPFIARALDYLVAQQKANGAIHDGRTSKDKADAQTRMAAAVLMRYADAELKEPLARVLAYVGEELDEGADGFPSLEHLVLHSTKKGIVDDANRRLEMRNEAGYWERGSAGREPVTHTAWQVLMLTRHDKALKAMKTTAPRQATELPTFEAANVARIDAALERGAEYLLGVAEDGLYGAPGAPDAGLTAMAVGALQCVPEPRPQEVQAAIDAGLAWLVSLQRDDGSIHDGKLANYITSAAILALARSKDKAHYPVVVRARDYLVVLQADEGEHYSPDHPSYGGIGYGGDERPDLSNLQMALEALVASGLEQDNPAFQRATEFLQRCQNRSESNTIEIVDGDTTFVSGNDGGSAYAPGNSPAGTIELADGRQVARSYGSMTYALLKGYLLAGVPKDDPRMQAAWEWLCANYTLDVNPGFAASSEPTAAYQGLFYYFLTMARALDLYGTETVPDAAGTEHPWRAQLSGRLIAMQRKTDGSWVNRNSPRWWEGNPILATSYAMLTLDAARP